MATTTTREKPDLKDPRLAQRAAERRERRRRRLDAASGGGAGAPGPNGSNGGDGGGSEGGGAGGSVVNSPGTKGTRQSGGNGGGAGIGGQGGPTGATYMQGGTITAGVSGTKGGDGKTGGSYGSGGGGGGAGVIASGPLLVQTATITGGDGGAGRGGPFGSGGHSGGGAGMVINGPGPFRVLPSAKVHGGSGAVSSSPNQGADGGGGVGVYFDGSTGTDVTNVWTNRGELVGGDSIEGGGGAGVVLSGFMTLKNEGGTIRGGRSDRTAGPGILMLGAGNIVIHTVAGGKIEGGSNDIASAITAPGIRVEGQENSVVTGSQILGGVNAIEFVGQGNVLSLWPGYAFLGNVVCQGPYHELVFAGPHDETFDLSSIGAVGSNAPFQGFVFIQKTGASTWTVSGVANGIEECLIDQGELKLIGSGDLSRVGQVNTDASSVLDLSGISAATATLPSLGVYESSELRIGAKALVLAGGGEITATISGTGGVTIKSFQNVPLVVRGGTIAAGAVAVQSYLLMDGGTIADDVTIDAGGELAMARHATFHRNFVVGGKLTVPDYGAQTGNPAGTIKGNLRFLGSVSQLNSYVESLDSSVIEISGTVTLNNVTVNILNEDSAIFGDVPPGTYHLLHANGGIGGTFTTGTLPDARCKLQITEDKKYLQLFISE
jgi:fibronectin-binding autotransporter adhesin